MICLIATVITDERLKTNPFTRFFNVAGVKSRLGLYFDENNHPKTKNSQALFDKQIVHIARSFLIPVATNDDKPMANTRTSAEIIFSGFDPGHSSIATTSANEPDKAGLTQRPGSSPTRLQRRRSKLKAAAASEFFENLTCSVQDNRLIGIADEIKRIDFKTMPIAASMLLRGLLESALDYQVRSVKKLGELQKYLLEKNNGKLRDVGLSDLIKFCSNKKNNVFISPRASDALQHSSVSVYKDQLDIIIHGKWAEADSDILLKAATSLRPIITYILEAQPQDYLEQLCYQKVIQ